MRLLIAALALWASCASAAADAPFLWQVRGGAATHHLLGSIHLLPAEALPLPAALQRAYDASARLLFETDLAALQAADVQRQLARAARDERGLRRRLAPATVVSLDRQLQRLGLRDDACDALRAWFCAMTLELTAFLRADFQPQYGIDAQLHARAVGDGREIDWLETPEQHLRLLTDIPDTLGSALLAATLDELDDPRNAPQQLLAAWRDGDLRYLGDLVVALKREHPDAYARLIGDRNRAWEAPLLEQLRGPVPVLVVVGAAHWVGPDGLVERLRARGLDVDAIGAQR